MDSLVDRRGIHRLGRTGTNQRTAILPALDAFWTVDERNYQSGSSGYCFLPDGTPFWHHLAYPWQRPTKKTVGSGGGILPRGQRCPAALTDGKTLLMIDFLKDLWDFMRMRKKFWLAPIIIVLLLLGLLIVLAEGSAVAPFIYTIF